MKTIPLPADSLEVSFDGYERFGVRAVPLIIFAGKDWPSYYSTWSWGQSGLSIEPGAGVEAGENAIKWVQGNEWGNGWTGWGGNFSTPVNMAYFTKIGLAEAGKYCQEQFTSLGWKEFKDEAAPGNDVAHVKMFQFRKNDARIQAIVYRGPNKLEEGPTSIAILSMSVAAPLAAENQTRSSSI